MTTKKVQVEYDSDADVLSFENTSPAPIDHAREMGNLVVHFGKNDEPVLIEVLEASKTFRGQTAPFEKIAAITEV